MLRYKEAVRKIRRDEKTSKVDVNSIKKYKSDSPSHEVNTESAASLCDLLLIYRSILSTRLPTEMTNGMTTFIYALDFSNATTEDMENAVVRFIRILHLRNKECVNDWHIFRTIYTAMKPLS